MLKKEIEEDHAELLLTITDGSKTDIDAWSGTDVYEFFTFMKMNAKRIKNLNKISNGI
jgi:hypothetical protein